MSAGTAIVIGIIAMVLLVIFAIGLALAFVVWLLRKTFTTDASEDHEHIHGSPL